MNKKRTICFVAGRSGGHIIPALTLARKARQKNQDTQILFFSTGTQLDNKITNASDSIDWHVPLILENIPRSKPWRLPIFFWHLITTFFCALKHLRAKKPSSVVSTGGYIAIPVCLAARVAGIPVELFELNVLPGKATKFLSTWAQTVRTCFQETKQYLPAQKCRLTNYPSRYQPVSNPEDARLTSIHQLGLDPAKKTVLVLGGSQGSLSINRKIGRWILDNPRLATTIQIIHQTGAHDTKNWWLFYKKRGVQAITADFFDNLEQLYCAADLVVCRSGAGSLFETVFFNKPCITIPLETRSNNHQLHNALAMQKHYPNLIEVIRESKQRGV